MLVFSKHIDDPPFVSRLSPHKELQRGQCYPPFGNFSSYTLFYSQS